MCGIAGFVGAGTLDDLKRMTDRIQHRGPDGEGHWQEGEVFLGHRRLSIIDIEGGAQPMWTADERLGVVFNGEIYNHCELRNALVAKGHEFQSDHSDTEVLLHGYREWGEALSERLNGMWAFAIYDRDAQRLFLSRDRFGQKPLFYTQQGALFAFASELTALTAHRQVQASICRRSLQKYFAYGYIPAPLSIHREVRKLPGGHNLRLELSTGRCELRKYWDYVIDPFEKIPNDPEAEWGEQLRELLGAAVERRLMSDVPLGVFLSGGIDSSAVSWFAQQVRETPIQTFAIGFEEASFDESRYARMAAEHVGSEHHVGRLSAMDAQQLAPSIAPKLDEPMGDSSLVPTYLLCGEARKSVTVALGGDGADELFAGYDPFRALAPARLYDRLVPKPVHGAIRAIMDRLPVSMTNMSLDFRIKRTLRGLSYERPLWNAVWLGPLGPVELGELFSGPIDLEDLYEEALLYWDACGQDNLADKTLQFYTKLYLQDDILVKVDRASMMHSLEVRAPFLDIDLINFVRRIPAAWKYRNGQTKYILKKALEPVLPHEILYRAKHGFGMPIAQWLREGALAISAPEVDGLSGNFVAEYDRQHRANLADHRAFLWNVWLLETWNASSAKEGKTYARPALHSAHV
jgi:asparagine synthase (glutamine-hydrolysing)